MRVHRVLNLMYMCIFWVGQKAWTPNMPSPLPSICSSSDDALFSPHNASLSLVSNCQVAFKGELLGVACSFQLPMVKATAVQFYSSLLSPVHESHRISLVDGGVAKTLLVASTDSPLT